ncbi:biotin-independent malonate decarboxylase subunit gamma [Sphingobium sp. HWE2-09]|uniref:biotin-independent malonate decarboxylase subunit gamma n=1 Tax=Sphingobium sp. HWE2-09 TaxID=3108390 RepID=UPI002DC1EA94|nr:biotin-independent malonate decarboxylase subunit gamma [Sphingobium sp. HWE2-09]
MTPADILASLFPHGHAVADIDHLPHGRGWIDADSPVHVVGITGGTFPGVDEALTVSARILTLAAEKDRTPILFLLDSGSQRMSKRDELLGLSETLAHLAKSLRAAEQAGHRTIGLLYGGTAAGAFIATALACETLVALPGAHPEVMDLPSMARVTKLSLSVLEEKARATPVFAPGLDNIVATGGIAAVWDESQPLAAQLAALLAQPASDESRAAMGQARGGRPKAAEIADRVRCQALAHD